MLIIYKLIVVWYSWNKLTVIYKQGNNKLEKWEIYLGEPKILMDRILIFDILSFQNIY